MQANADIVRNMAGKSVLVVGDIMLDRFVYGRVDRISPEGPVPVLSIARENMMLGGAGNTLSNLAHLGCHGKLISVVGDDADGKTVAKLAQDLGVDIEGLVRLSDRPTIVKTRYLVGHQQLLRTDFERICDIAPETQNQLLQHMRGLLNEVGAVIISDYGKGLLVRSFIEELIKLVKSKNIPVLVDPKGRDFSKYSGADVVTPNKKELSEATGGKSLENDEQIVFAGKEILKNCGIGAVVATRSSDGMSVIGASEPVHIRSAKDIEVFDVSGAGDTVIATIAAALAAGADLVQAASIANIAGSIVVTKVGTAPIHAQELITTLEAEAGIEEAHRAAVLDWKRAKEQVSKWKAQGLRVGFTNGCFDILHYGHVTYLNDARKKCDRLIVALNSDSSVRILKGTERPVHDENSRAAVLVALGAVDMVVHFGAEKSGDDNTARALLETLQPDIYFKGGDYTVDQIPEAPTVMRYGGVVDVMPVYEGHSTTNSIKKMRSGVGC